MPIHKPTKPTQKKKSKKKKAHEGMLPRAKRVLKSRGRDIDAIVDKASGSKKKKKKK